MSSREDFRLGSVAFRPALDEISGPAGEIHLQPKVMDLAVYLAGRIGQVVERDTLIDEVWNGYPGANQSLTNAASKLRQALAEVGGDPDVLQTIPRRGYCLTGQIERIRPSQSRKSVARVAALALGLFAIVLLLSYWPPEDARSTEPSIAVLPFENMSPDPDQEYFADGLAEEILNLLASVEKLKVAARTSSFLFDEADADIIEVGRALNVDNVIEGSVRKDGDRVRVTIQLIDADDGYHLWSQTFQRELKDIFEIQDEIARAVVDALRVEVLAPPRQRLERTRTESLEAYDLYLAGRHLFNNRGQGPDLDYDQKIIDLFERAVEIDPEFAPAWSGIADAYNVRPDWWLVTHADWAEVSQRALDAARRAVALQPELAEAQASLGMALFRFANDEEQGRRHLKKAIELNPGYLQAYQWLAYNFRHAGRLSDALPLLEKAAKLDPLNTVLVSWYAKALGAAGRFDESIAELERILEYRHALPLVHDFRAQEAFQTGQFVQAHRWMKQWIELYDAPEADKNTPCCRPTALYQLARLEVMLGRFDAAESLVGELRTSAPSSTVLAADAHSWWLNGTGQYSRLQAHIARMINPNLPPSIANRVLNAHGRASLLAGDLEAAIDSLESAGNWTDWRYRTAGRGMLAIAYHRSQRREAAHQLAEQALSELEQAELQGYRRPFLFGRKAAMLALLARQEEALAALRQAYELGWRHYHAANSFRPFLDQFMRDEPRYQALMDRVLDDIEAMRAKIG